MFRPALPKRVRRRDHESAAAVAHGSRRRGCRIDLVRPVVAERTADVPGVAVVEADTRRERASRLHRDDRARLPAARPPTTVRIGKHPDGRGREPMPHVEVRQPAFRGGVASLLRRVVVAVARQERRCVVDRLGPRVGRAQRQAAGALPLGAQLQAHGTTRRPRARRAGCRRSPQSAGAGRAARGPATGWLMFRRRTRCSPCDPTYRTPRSTPRTRASRPRLPWPVTAVSKSGCSVLTDGDGRKPTPGRERVRERQRLPAGDEHLEVEVRRVEVQRRVLDEGAAVVIEAVAAAQRESRRGQAASSSRRCGAPGCCGPCSRPIAARRSRRPARASRWRDRRSACDPPHRPAAGSARTAARY